MPDPISGRLVDGVFRRVLGPELTPELKAALHAAGLDLAPPVLEPKYPRETWHRAVALTAAALYPTEPAAGQLRRLGHHVLEALLAQGRLQGPWLVMGRLLGPRRALLQAVARTDRSPIKVKVTELSRTRFEVWADEPEQPEFLAGLLEGACLLLGGKEPAVQVLGPRGEGSLLLATWR
jgi:uncharacterized protein (TIGR02265 family)